MEKELVCEGSLFYRYILPRSAHGNAAGLVELADHGEAYEVLDDGLGGLEPATSPLSGVLADRVRRRLFPKHCSRSAIRYNGLGRPLLGMCACLTLTLAVKTIGRSGGDLENRLSLNLAIV